MNSDRLEVKDLRVFAKNREKDREIVKGINFILKKGERLAIVGESGCGKTMTVMSLFQLLPGGCYAKGNVLLGETDLIQNDQKTLRRGREIVLIPQSGMEFLDPVFKIKTQIIETLKLLGVPKENRWKRAIELLTRVGLNHPEVVMEQYPFELSGGMAQRVILAIGIAADPQVIVADEPTRGIDSEGVDDFIELLETVFADKILILVTHNIKVARHCTEVLVMYSGEVMELGDSSTVLDGAVHPYTRDLLHAIPSDLDFLKEIELHEFREMHETGCPYYPRCKRAEERCSIEHPDLYEKDGIRRRCFYA